MKETGLITLDSGFMNTGATESQIAFINGGEGLCFGYGLCLDRLGEKLVGKLRWRPKERSLGRSA